MSAAPARILIVEDDPSIRILIRLVLDEAGHDVHEVDHGDEAIGAIRSLRPALVLLDIGLPGLNGLQVLAALRADPELRGTRVLVVSAWAEDATVRQVLDLGVLGFVRKPFAVEELGALVEDSLRDAG